MKGWPGEIRVEADVIQAEQEAAQAKGQPIEQVIFDFGNVLIRWQPEMAMVARYGRKSIEAMLDDSRSGFYRANNMMDGGATCDQARDWVADNCGAPWDAMFAYYCDHFVDSLAGPVKAGTAVIQHGFDALAPVPGHHGHLGLPTNQDVAEVEDDLFNGLTLALSCFLLSLDHICFNLDLARPALHGSPPFLNSFIRASACAPS